MCVNVNVVVRSCCCHTVGPSDAHVRVVQILWDLTACTCRDWHEINSKCVLSKHEIHVGDIINFLAAE